MNESMWKSKRTTARKRTERKRPMKQYQNKRKSETEIGMNSMSFNGYHFNGSCCQWNVCHFVYMFFSVFIFLCSAVAMSVRWHAKQIDKLIWIKPYTYTRGWRQNEKLALAHHFQLDRIYLSSFRAGGMYGVRGRMNGWRA